jgi:hypothetical protein
MIFGAAYKYIALMAIADAEMIISAKSIEFVTDFAIFRLDII